MSFADWIKWGFPIFDTHRQSYRYHSLLPGHGQHSVVGVGPTSCRIYEDVDVVVDDMGGHRLPEHDLNIFSFENLLQGIKGQPRELRLNEVRPILHNSLELEMPVCRLPPAQVSSMQQHRDSQETKTTHCENIENRESLPWYQVQHVNTVCSSSLGFARRTSQLDAEIRKHGLSCQPVPHLHQPSVKVNLASQSRDC